MNTEENNQAEEAEETSEEQAEDVVTLSKEDYEKLQQDIGSLKRENKDLKKPKVTEKQEEAPASTEPDYAKLAYLKSESVTHPDDQKVVMDEAKRLNLPLTDVLQMEHIKSKIQNNTDQREAQDGLPNGKGRKGGANKNDVDYYLQHPDEHPDDLELANKVIDAKMNKEVNSNKFSTTLYSG